jgi:hypothetical protein
MSYEYIVREGTPIGLRRLNDGQVMLLKPMGQDGVDLQAYLDAGGVIREPAPSPAYDWDGTQWVETPERAAEYAQAQAIAQMTVAAEAVRVALQAAIDAKARELGFSGGNTLMLYAGFKNTFTPLAQQFGAWEASVWIAADAYKSEVVKGAKQMVSPDEAVAMMPEYPEGV